MSVLVITGTDTGVGKTVATAALASHARQAGIDVAVCKPAQTGTRDGDDDLAEVARLADITSLVPGWRYPEPLAPLAAAELAGLTLPSRDELVALVRNVDRPRQLTLVEGAGDCSSNSAPTARRCATWPSSSGPRCWSSSHRAWALSTTRA